MSIKFCYLVQSLFVLTNAFNTDNQFVSFAFLLDQSNIIRVIGQSSRYYFDYVSNLQSSNTIGAN